MGRALERALAIEPELERTPARVLEPTPEQAPKETLTRGLVRVMLELGPAEPELKRARELKLDWAL